MTRYGEAVRVLDPAVAGLVRDVPDFPTPGILFKDITPLLGDAAAWRHTVDVFAQVVEEFAPTHVVGIEARGFVLAAPIAYRLGIGFVPVRKPGKLPHATTGVGYDLEYGSDGLEVHLDAFGPGDRVVVVDDVLATGGTAAAASELVARTGAGVVGAGFLIELDALAGRSRLPDHPVVSLLRY